METTESPMCIIYVVRMSLILFASNLYGKKGNTFFDPWIKLTINGGWLLAIQQAETNQRRLTWVVERLIVSVFYCFGEIIGLPNGLGDQIDRL